MKMQAQLPWKLDVPLLYLSEEVKHTFLCKSFFGSSSFLVLSSNSLSDYNFCWDIKLILL